MKGDPAPSAADLADIVELREMAMMLARDVVQIAQTTRDAKDFEIAGKQVARAYEMSGLPVKERQVVLGQIRAEVDKMRTPKPSRRRQKSSDVEAKIAEAKGKAGEVRH